MGGDYKWLKLKRVQDAKLKLILDVNLMLEAKHQVLEVVSIRNGYSLEYLFSCTYREKMIK